MDKVQLTPPLEKGENQKGKGEDPKGGGKTKNGEHDMLAVIVRCPKQDLNLHARKDTTT